MPARPVETMPCADRHTERIPPPAGTRGVLGAHRCALRGAAVGLRG
ncbi:hypothetical protein ACFY2N_27710 [Streptomyces rubiginosohelvolus]